MRIILITVIILFSQYSFSMLIPIPGTAEHVRMMEDIASMASNKLSAAIECNMVWRVEELLKDHPTIVNRSDSSGYTPLSKAAFYNNPIICKKLLDYHADPNKGNRINITPLHVTTNLTIINFLLDAGADINAKNVHGTTPLLHAMYASEWGKIDFLLSKGAQIDQVMLAEFEKKFIFSMFATQETNDYCRERIKNRVLPFLVNKQIIKEETEQQEIVAEDKEEKAIEEVVLTNVECFICMNMFETNIKNSENKIPCFNDNEIRHKEEFLCISCCNAIKKSSNTCPLCRRELGSK